MNLKQLRKENKKSQTEVAKLLNITQQTYARYELETSEPTIDTLCKLADYYGVSLDFLVGRTWANEFGYMADNEKMLVTDFRKLNQYNQAKIIGEVVGMLSVQN